MESFPRQKIKEILREKVVKCYQIRNNNQDANWVNNKKIFKNTLDPFSAVLDAKIMHSSIDEWIKNVELARQKQKSLQNEIGNIHQEILGSLDGWSDLGIGGVIDLENKEKKIIAEIKNKWNTTKGNHMTEIYDDINHLLKNKYLSYVGYYVEILPKNGKKYNKNFTPSDNKKKERRPDNVKIRVIDGESFYELVTGNKNALRILFNEFPILIDEILKEEFEGYESSELGGKEEILFNTIFPKK